MTSTPSTIALLDQPFPERADTDVRHWWLRLALFLSPVIITGCGLEYLLWRTGETWPLAKVARFQAEKGGVFMREFMPQDHTAHKLELLSHLGPRVMVLSSSRGMQIRASMIGESKETFLNGGGMIYTIGDLEHFLSSTPKEHMPDVIILAVDLWWFNEKWPGEARPFDPDGAYNWRAHLSAARHLVADPPLMASLLEAPSAEQSHRIGISAQRTGSGFRFDGSVKQVLPVPDDPSKWTYQDREHPPVIDRVRKGITNFQEAHRADPARLERFAAFLAKCHRMGIQVAAFTPPFSTEVFEALTTDPRHRDFFSSFRRELPALFSSHGVPFVDASDLKSLGLDDRSMFDGFHPAETFYLHLLRRMLNTFPQVEEWIPSARYQVEKGLGSSKTNFWYADI